jgi:hypothetical protein
MSDTEITYVDNWEIVYSDRAPIGFVMYFIRGDVVDASGKSSPLQFKFQSTFVDLGRIATNGELPDKVPHLPCRRTSENLRLLKPNAEFLKNVETVMAQYKLQQAIKSGGGDDHKNDSSIKISDEEWTALKEFFATQASLDYKTASNTGSAAYDAKALALLFEGRGRSPLTQAYCYDVSNLDLECAGASGKAKLKRDGTRLIKAFLSGDLATTFHRLTKEEMEFVGNILHPDKNKCRHWTAKRGAKRLEFYYDEELVAAKEL